MGKLPGRGEREAFVRVVVSKGVQVSTGAILHHNAREMRGLELRVERREEGVVHHLQNLSLHLRSLRLLLQRHRLLVHHLHRVEALLLVVAEAAEVHGADVAGADAAEEVEVAEGEGGVAAEDGGVGEVGGAVRLDEQALRRGGGRGEVEGEAAEAGAANALVAHGSSLRGIDSL